MRGMPSRTAAAEAAEVERRSALLTAVLARKPLLKRRPGVADYGALVKREPLL